MSHYTIEIADRRTPLVADHLFIDTVIRRVLMEQRVRTATISLALVDDVEIRQLNRQYLGHDYSTDVISFLLDSASGTIGNAENEANDDTEPGSCDEAIGTNGLVINGELIVSHETAFREASAHGWSPLAELLLYIVHGLLHLCGFDDLTDEARPIMRSRERELLAIWGFIPTGLEP